MTAALNDDKERIYSLAAARIGNLRLDTQQKKWSGVAAPWEDETTYVADAVNRLRSQSPTIPLPWVAVRLCGTTGAYHGVSGIAQLTGIPESTLHIIDESTPLPSVGIGIVVIVNLHRGHVEQPSGSLAFWHDSQDSPSLARRLTQPDADMVQSFLEQFSGHRPFGLDTDLQERRIITSLEYWQLHLSAKGSSQPTENFGDRYTSLTGYKGAEPAYRRAIS